jgi:hypothetical protein
VRGAGRRAATPVRVAPYHPPNEPQPKPVFSAPHPIHFLWLCASWAPGAAPLKFGRFLTADPDDDASDARRSQYVAAAKAVSSRTPYSIKMRP